jgi:hypothetical protein
MPVPQAMQSPEKDRDEAHNEDSENDGRKNRIASLLIRYN